MKIARITFLACSLLVLTPAVSGLRAQSNMSGLQNIARQQDQAWKKVASDHFDVHYYSPDPGLANLATRYAEEALWDICRMLDYNNRSHFALYLFLTPEDLARSNIYPFPTPKSGGVTPIRNNATPILFPGSHLELQKRIRAEVARLLMEDFYFGGGIQASIQNTVLLHLPEWYSEGFAAYVGEGWSYTDELWLSGLEHANLLSYAIEGNEYIHRVARKSIWYYIATQYGKEKLAEIFYMTRLTRSAEDGIVHVLGITLKTLTERWREFVLQRITENHNFRDNVADQASRVRLDHKGRLMGIAMNPAAPLVALQFEREGRHELALYDLEKGELKRTPIHGGWRTNQFAPFEYEFPMAWSPDGKQLLTTTYTRSGEQMVLWSRETGKLTEISFKPRLERIFQIAWSHDGKQIVVSALRAGTIDLYKSTPGSNGFVQLTEDIFDDLNPVWSQDDQRIYYASTRPNDSIDAQSIRFNANQHPFDVWEIELESSALRQVSHSPLIDEMPVQALSSFELLLRTNQSGIWNLERRNVFAGDSIPQTNVTHGMYQVSMNDSLIVFTLPERGKLLLYQASSQQLLRSVVSLKSPLRMREDKASLAISRNAQQQAIRDSIAKAQRNEVVKTKEVPNDTTGGKKVKYYVFDDEGDETKQRRSITRSRANIIRKEAPTKPDFQAMTIKSPVKSRTEWAADRVSTRLGFDPVFKLNMLYEARLRDHLGNKALSIGFMPFIDLKSSDTYLRYQNNAHKLDYYAGFSRSTRLLNRLDFTVRYNATRVEGGLILPINRFLSAGISAHSVYIDRHNMEVRVPKEIDGRELLTGLRGDIQYDHTDRNGVFVKSGTFAQLSIQDVASIKGRYNQFMTASWDLRKYFPVKRFVLATRVAGALSVGRYPQRYYVGGTDDWLFSQFSNPADYPIQDVLADFHYMGYGTPIRGFRFNARNGSRYLVANTELRIPVSRIFRNSFNTNPLFNFEIIPFFDLGTAWTRGNPFSQRNPIDTETIETYPLTITVQTLKSPFIMGFGAGTRLQLFGYGVRFDLGWGIEDYTLQKPRLHVSLAKNF